MKKIISKVQDLSRKAAEFKQTLEQVPPKIVELGQTVTATAGQIQQLKTDVQSSIAGLSVENESRLTQVMKEINSAGDVFNEAGYELARVEMELSPVRQLIVHLEKVDTVPQTKLQQLILGNQSAKTVHGILTSILRAEEASSAVEMSDLAYTTLVVHVGPVPVVRLRWSADAREEVPQPSPVTPKSQIGSSQPELGQIGTYFERRSPQAIAPGNELPKSWDASEKPQEQTSPQPSGTGKSRDWKPSALDRFKKMPDLSKLKR